MSGSINDSSSSGKRSGFSERSWTNSPRKRNYNDGEEVTPSKLQRMMRPVSSIFFPDCLHSIVEQDSFIENLSIVNCTSQMLEDIEKPDKFILNFELFKLQTYPEQDLAVLKVRDGTTCPSSVLRLPNYSSWQEIEHSVRREPIYRSNEPVVDILLYNSSFIILNFKEFFCYSMANVMAVRTAGRKGLLVCANGKDAYLTKLKASNQILSKLADKKYQELEEKYIQSLSYLEKCRFLTANFPSPKNQSIVTEDKITNRKSDTKETSKSRKLKSEEDDNEEEDSVARKRVKTEVRKLKTSTVRAKEVGRSPRGVKVDSVEKRRSATKLQDQNDGDSKDKQAGGFNKQVISFKKSARILLRKLKSDCDDEAKIRSHSVKELKKKVETTEEEKEEEDDDDDSESGDDDDDGESEDDSDVSKTEKAKKITKDRVMRKKKNKITSSRKQQNDEDSGTTMRRSNSFEDSTSKKQTKINKNCENGKQKKVSRLRNYESSKIIRSITSETSRERTTQRKLKSVENSSKRSLKGDKKEKITSDTDEENEDVHMYKNLSDLTGEMLSVDVFGVIKNILKEEGVNKWRVAVEIMDQTTEYPFKVHLFLPKATLISLTKVMEKYQIIEFIGMKVGKCNLAVTGRVFASTAVKLYSSVTGEPDEGVVWQDSSDKFKPSGSSLKVIENLRIWAKEKYILPQVDIEQAVERLSTLQSSLRHEENECKSLSRKENCNKDKLKTESKSDEKITPSKNKKDLYTLLGGIVLRENIDKTRNEIVYNNQFHDFKDITEDMKLNTVFEIFNIHHYYEINAVVIQVRDGTICSLPMLHIPLENSWHVAKQTILNNPLYTRDSPVLDILCFDGIPHLPPLQVGMGYHFKSLIVLETQLPSSSEEKDGYMICVDCKDCDATEAKRKRKMLDLIRNKADISATEAKFFNSVFHKSKGTVYYPEFLRPVGIDLVEEALPVSQHIVEKEQIHNIEKKTETCLNSTTLSLVDLDITDVVNTEIAPGLVRELESMMQEESALGLAVTLSEDIHLKNTDGSDPTYSQFAKHANERSKMNKTSTQAVDVNELVFTLSRNSIKENLNDPPAVLDDRLIYSPNCDSFPVTSENKNTLDKGNFNNNEEEIHSDAGSESILNLYCVKNLKELDENLIISENKMTKEKSKLRNEEVSSDSSSIEITELEENISSEESSVNLLNVMSNSRQSLATKTTPETKSSSDEEKPVLLIQALLRGNVKLPSHCFYKKDSENQEFSSDDSSEVQSEVDCEELEKCSFTSNPERCITTVTDFPDLPVVSFKTLFEIKNANCHNYTTIPLKLSPELKDGWEEKCIHCVCRKCNKTFALNELKRISGDGNDNWPDRSVPVCRTSECNEEHINVANTFFHFEMELNLVRFNLQCTATLKSKSAEIFLDCSTLDFIKSVEKREQVSYRLKQLFLRNKTDSSNIYSFTLTRKNICDPSSSPLYITNIQLK